MKTVIIISICLILLCIYLYIYWADWRAFKRWWIAGKRDVALREDISYCGFRDFAKRTKQKSVSIRKKIEENPSMIWDIDLLAACRTFE
jgi:predicted membrane metal-binding protein